MKKVLKNNKGFTLIELIVVLVVLTILMCLTAPSVFGYSRKAQETAAIEECKGVVSAVIDIFSDDYVNTGTRITGTECLNTERGKEIIDEAKRMADVDGNVNGAWVRGNEQYILSHLVYEWSDNLWVVYDKGEYKIYKGKNDTPAEDKVDGTEPSGKPKNEPSNSYNPDGGDDGEESTNGFMQTPTAATTEAATEATTKAPEPTTKAPEPTTEKTPEPTTEKTPETPTMKDNDGNVYAFGEGRWEDIKRNSQVTNPGDPWGSMVGGDANSVTMINGYAYSDSSGIYVCVANEVCGPDLDPNMTIEEYYNRMPDSEKWRLIKVDINRPVFLQKDYDQDKLAGGGWIDNVYYEKDPDNYVILTQGDIKCVDGNYYVWSPDDDSTRNSIISWAPDGLIRLSYFWFDGRFTKFQ